MDFYAPDKDMPDILRHASCYAITTVAQYTLISNILKAIDVAMARNPDSQAILEIQKTEHLIVKNQDVILIERTGYAPPFWERWREAKVAPEGATKSRPRQYLAPILMTHLRSILSEPAAITLFIAPRKGRLLGKRRWTENKEIEKAIRKGRPAIAAEQAAGITE